ncbi:MAG: hypothetical protein ACRDRN_24130, partial [Sciscionella sp.]
MTGIVAARPGAAVEAGWRTNGDGSQELRMLSTQQRRDAAERLWAAERDRAPIAPLTESFENIDVTDAYEIQLVNIARRRAAGATVYGHKVGLSSPVMQQMMGVDEPDYGHL